MQFVNAPVFAYRKKTQLEVGEIVYVEKGEVFPADLVLLSSSEPAGERSVH